MKYFLVLAFVLLSYANALMAQETSVSNKIVIDQKSYTLHKVGMGETLFSISKNYEIPVEAIKKTNRLGEGNTIDFDRILIIPLFAALDKKEKETIRKTSSAYLTHKVKQGETLYSIARQYDNVKPEQIKLMNNLKSDTLKIGMLLDVPVEVTDIQKDSSFTLEEEIDLKDSTLIQQALFQPDSLGLSKVEDDTLLVEDSVKIAQKKTLMQYRGTFESIDTVAESFEVSRGIGTWMETPDMGSGPHFYAQHISAPIGSIVKVRNLMNNRMVYVKVIGKLTPSEQKRKIIVKISESAAQFLNILDEKFLVEIIEKKSKS